VLFYVLYFIVVVIELHLRGTECHLPYGITQSCLPPDTSEQTPH